MSLLDKASLIVTPNAYKTSKLYSVVPNTTLGDMDVVRATTATRVNASGLIESVGLNIPRIDYTNGSCPSILVEPQRTNILTYSNNFTNWSFSGVTLTPNFAVSPDGTLNATRYQANSGSFLFRGYSSTANLTHSVWVKSNTGINQNILFGGQTSSTFVVTNEWKRINKSIIIAESSTQISASQTTDILIWGAQSEVGSYPTSYIPTVASTVTRNADVISKTGISSLIGQTEGTVFVDINVDLSYTQTDMRFINVSDGTSTNWWFIGTGVSNQIRFYYKTGATVYVSQLVTLTSGRHKLAFAYKSNDYVAYVDGLQVYSLNSLVVGATSQIDLGNAFIGAVVTKKFINSAQLYKTRLTNTELQSLTTL